MKSSRRVKSALTDAELELVTHPKTAFNDDDLIAVLIYESESDDHAIPVWIKADILIELMAEVLGD